ncbi:hypothetical protein [Nocardiopsis sp. JB363]|uniref:hypothetical protein n=1 Tax=Nocardiopsis sp. JB363 TaxID=1434837 RepID=UPI000979FCDA|nr:hypothetical protein [Nocardiopsis sp. JB363]SIO86149.1 Streptococcal hemagglutinin protein [Nocardiopsis sp. JB363]
MSTRKSFDDLIAEDADSTEPVTPAPPPPAPARALRSQDRANRPIPGLPKSVSPKVPKSGSTEVPESQTPATAPRRRKKAAPPKPEGPKWSTLERKETLLWPDQASGLTELRRSLQRRKRAAGGGGERITENTLIRVAVATLLEHGDALTGVDEAELRESLSSVLRNSGSSELRDS